jgi:hypothetical protein
VYEEPGLLVNVHLVSVLPPPQADDAPLVGVQARAGHRARLHIQQSLEAVLGIHEILVQIRIRFLSSVTLRMLRKIFFFLIFISYNLGTHRHIIFSLKNLICC